MASETRGFPHENRMGRFPVDGGSSQCYTPAHSNILGFGIGGPHNIVGPEGNLEGLESAR